jgi:hypothetical protein
MHSVRTGTEGVRARALAVIASVVLLTLSLSIGVASADSGRDHRNAENTFTKFVTSQTPVPPVIFFMAGVVGGDVGEGTYAGEVLGLTATSTTLTIDAAYHFNGSRHSFTALVHVVQTGFTNGSTAVITGQVTDGWLKGNQVRGEYTVISCTQAPDGTCFQGTLDILRGSKSED